MNSEQNPGKDEIVSCNPLVSVIIPAYNAEQFIEPTLHSVISQTYKNLEVIVVDDGSCDRTAEIVRRFAQQDDRVTLLQQPNSGVAAARNLAIQHSKGELIAPIDADDIWYPENLQRQVQCIMQADTSVGVVYAWSVDIDEQSFLTGEFHAAKISGNVYLTLLCHNFIGNASSTLIRRTCLESVGTYNCELKRQGAQGCEDWELYLRLAERYQFQVVPEFLIEYRKITNSMSHDHSGMAKSHALMLKMAQKKHPETPNTLHQISSSSFYVYLAYQSYSQQHYQNTLFWLFKAWRVDRLISPLRPGLYLLLISSLIQLSLQNNLGGWQQNILGVPAKVDPARSRSSAINIRPHQLSVRLKVLVGSLLHQFIPVFAGANKNKTIQLLNSKKQFNY